MGQSPFHTLSRSQLSCHQKSWESHGSWKQGLGSTEGGMSEKQLFPNLRKGQSMWSWHSGTVLLLVTHVILSVQSHSQLSPPFQEKLKLFQLCENAWTSHLAYCRPLTLSPLSHQTLKITDFCLQSLDISPIFALIAFGPPALVSHICKLHGSGFSGDHLKVAGGKIHH